MEKIIICAVLAVIGTLAGYGLCALIIDAYKMRKRRKKVLIYSQVMSYEPGEPDPTYEWRQLTSAEGYIDWWFLSDRAVMLRDLRNPQILHRIEANSNILVVEYEIQEVKK